MAKIVITSDSTTDLGAALQQQYDIKILPLGVVLGDKLYTDGVDITPDDIYAHHDKTGELPKTNASNVENCLEFFRPFTDAGDTVIHFTISSEMSSNYNNARIAADELGNVFVIDNLEYLYKGGRCSALAMFGANLLKLKPCIQVKDGKMDVRKKFRGKFDAVLREYIDEQLSDPDDLVTDRVFITHAGCDPQLVSSLREYVESRGIFKEVFVTRAGCTVSSHCGANTLGILFIRKSPLK